MTPDPQHREPSSEPSWLTVYDGSDRDWRLISMYQLQELEYAINEECVGKNDGCPPGHLKEMHDSGNEIIDKVRASKRVSYIHSTTPARNDSDVGLLYLATGILVLTREGIPSKKEDVEKAINELSLLAKQLRQQQGGRE